jgi:hypothetical protein
VKLSAKEIDMTQAYKAFFGGINATCQFGNEGDMDFTKSAEVVIIGNKGSAFAETYLVLDKTNGKLGRATKAADDEITATYYCTDARKIGPNWSIDKCLVSLGFSEVMSSEIQTHM